MTIIKGLVPSDWLVDSRILQSTSGIILCHCFGCKRQTCANVFFTIWLSRSTNEFLSRWRGVDQMGLHPNIFRNFAVSSAVKQVPWSEVIFYRIPTLAKTSIRHSQTALAAADLNVYANGYLVWESTRLRQYLYSPYSNKGPMISMYRCDNGTGSLGMTEIGTLSFTTAPAADVFLAYFRVRNRTNSTKQW